MSCGIINYQEFRRAHMDYSDIPPRGPRCDPVNCDRVMFAAFEEREIGRLWQAHKRGLAEIPYHEYP